MGGVLSPAASTRPPPGQRPSRSVDVYGLCYGSFAWYLADCHGRVFFVFSFVSEFVGLMLAIKGPAKSWVRLLGFLVFCRYVVMLCASRGGSRGGGILGSLGTTVPWGGSSRGQEGRAVHGPRHPALHIPLRLVRGFDRLLCCALLVFCVCVSFVLVISSWGLICCMVISPFRTRPLSVRVFAPLLSLCLVGSPSTFFFFFFRFLSFFVLQVLGKHKPFSGLCFPLCFFVLAAHYVFNPFLMVNTLL